MKSVMAQAAFMQDLEKAAAPSASKRAAGCKANAAHGGERAKLKGSSFEDVRKRAATAAEPALAAAAAPAQHPPPMRDPLLYPIVVRNACTPCSIASAAAAAAVAAVADKRMHELVPFSLKQGAVSASRRSLLAVTDAELTRSASDTFVSGSQAHSLSTTFPTVRWASSRRASARSAPGRAALAEGPRASIVPSSCARARATWRSTGPSSSRS